MDPTSNGVADPIQQQLEIYDSLFSGVGPGVVAVMVTLILAILFCFCKNACIYPNCCLCCAFMVPVIILIFLIAMPKQSIAMDEQKKDTIPTSWYFIKTLTFTALSAVTMICAILCLCTVKIKPVKIRRIDSELQGNDIVTTYDNKTGYD